MRTVLNFMGEELELHPLFDFGKEDAMRYIQQWHEGKISDADLKHNLKIEGAPEDQIDEFMEAERAEISVA